MAKLPLQNSPKPLSPLIRQRLTLQSALMINPQRYIKNVRFDEEKSEKVIPEREAPPKPEVVSEKTQTLDVMDAETNTKLTRFSIESKKIKLKAKCSSWAKDAKMISRNPYAEISRRLKHEGISAPQKMARAQPLAAAADSTKDLPGVKRHRGILKKVLEEVKIEGMCSQGTVTEGKRPTLDRILKENHIFMKYSKGSKPKKKRVRMEKEPAFSYFNQKSDQESLPSVAASEEKQEARGERPKRVMIADVDSLDSLDLDEPDLERKPARLALRASSGDSNADPDETLSVLVARSSTRRLISADSLEDQTSYEELRPASLRDICSKPSQDSIRKPQCRVPRDRLCFKNVFSSFPGAHRR